MITASEYIPLNHPFPLGFSGVFITTLKYAYTLFTLFIGFSQVFLCSITTLKYAYTLITLFYRFFSGIFMFEITANVSIRMYTCRAILMLLKG